MHIRPIRKLAPICLLALALCLSIKPGTAYATASILLVNASGSEELVPWVMGLLNEAGFPVSEAKSSKKLASRTSVLCKDRNHPDCVEIAKGLLSDPDQRKSLKPDARHDVVVVVGRDLVEHIKPSGSSTRTNFFNIGIGGILIPSAELDAPDTGRQGSGFGASVELGLGVNFFSIGLWSDFLLVPLDPEDFDEDEKQLNFGLGLRLNPLRSWRISPYVTALGGLSKIIDVDISWLVWGVGGGLRVRPLPDSATAIRIGPRYIRTSTTRENVIPSHFGTFLVDLVLEWSSAK